MANILILAPEVATESAQLLGRYLGCGIVNPFKINRRDFKEYDIIFNYGCNRKTTHNIKINTSGAVARCRDKLETFRILSEANIPVPNYRTHYKDVPKTWNIVVGREILDAAKNKGMQYFRKGEALPDYPLFTEWYDHNSEIRVVVYKGAVIGRYVKDRVKDQWLLQPVQKKGFSAIDKHAIKAAAALKIDYVGFDILAKDQKNYVFLEANSAPILTEEVAQHIAKDLLHVG